MSWFSELYDLYEKNEEKIGRVEYKTRQGKKGPEQVPLVLLPIFHTTVAAQITVDIDSEGNILGASRVPDEDKMTIIPVTETSGIRTSGVEAHPFCDNLKYLAADYARYVKNEKKDFSKNHKLYIEGLKSWHLSEYTHPKVDALYAYLSKGTLMADLVEEGVLITDEKGVLLEKEKIQIVSQADAFVRFRIIEKADLSQDILNDPSGRYFSECWLDGTLQKSYIKYHRSRLTQTDFCYLTGENVPVSYLQPKKIRNEGDGAKLISSNDEDNYTFKGRFTDKTEAFAIGYETSQKAHNALKWIIRKQGYSWDDLCIVIWESNLEPIPDWGADTDKIEEAYQEAQESEYEGWGEEEEQEEKEYETGAAAAARFKAAMRGYGENLKTDSKVMILAFDAATTGRLAMVENKEFAASRYVDNIKYWHDSCRWLQSKYKDGHNFRYFGMAGVKDIAEALYGTEQKGIISLGGNTRMYAEVCKRLLPCISERRRVPRDIVNAAVQKASSPVSYDNRYNWEKVLSIACALVKKQKMEVEKEEWKVSLNEESRNRDYLYGRLLAMADRIEYRTFDRDEDGKRVTNAKRYMNAFAQHPYQTWKVLEERIQPYLQKLDIKERNSYNKTLDEIYELFDEKEFTNNDRLEGLYLLGYHSQSYELKYRPKKAEEEKE